MIFQVGNAPDFMICLSPYELPTLSPPVPWRSRHPLNLSPPNAAGVTAGHEVFRFRDLDAATKFWAALGGEPTELGPLKMTKFPGALFLVRQGEPNGPMEGSTIQYFGFKVKSLKESLAKWDMLDIKPMPGGSAKQVFLMGPDGVKVRITEDRSVSTWIVADQIKMVVPDVAAAEAWYAKVVRSQACEGRSGTGR